MAVMIENEIEKMKLGDLLKKYPFVEELLSDIGIKSFDKLLTLRGLVSSFSDEYLEDLGIERDKIIYNVTSVIKQTEENRDEKKEEIYSVTIIGGQNKYGERENIDVTLKRGEVVSIVGPTGSGKSRMLGDIECLAQKDTQTGRQVLINDKAPDEDMRYQIENRLIAQLSQNMNFIMDVTVWEFVKRHAESRRIDNVQEVVKSIIDCANELAGEKFSPDTPLTQLSGGQSRALMIADTALLSKSPIVLIDEIENAGVDRQKALELLVKSEKIVLMATHDPILALMGDKRIVIKNGGIADLIETDEMEKLNLKLLSSFDNKTLFLRDLLRSGKKIDFNIWDYMLLDK